MTLAVMAEVKVFNEILIDELVECFESDDERREYEGRIRGVETPAFQGFHPGLVDRVKTALGPDYTVDHRERDAFEVELVVRDRDGDSVGGGCIVAARPVGRKAEMTLVAAEATLFGEVIFGEEKEYSLEGEYAFDGIRAGIIDRIEEELEWEYQVEDRLTDGYEVQIRIYDGPGDQVGEGYIRA